MPNYSTGLDAAFDALASPTRRAVLSELSREPATVGELARPFDMALPSFLRHITLLQDAGCLTSVKSGRVRTCRIVPEPLDGARDWLAQQRSVWESRADRLERFLLVEDR